MHPRICQAAVFLCFLLGAAAAMAAEPSAGFERGNSLYKEGKYAEAASAYESQVKRGDFSADLFYNLANAYYRAGQRGRAILNYERVLLLDPRHPETKANLAFVRAHGPSTEWLDNGWRGTLAAVPIDTYVQGAAAAFWVALAALLAAAFLRKARLANGLVAVVLLAVCGGCIWAVNWLDDGAKNPALAFVVDDQTAALYAPADTSKMIATLPAGAELRILSDQGKWTYVRLADGALAWVPSSHIEAVLPMLAAGYGSMK